MKIDVKTRKRQYILKRNAPSEIISSHFFFALEEVFFALGVASTGH